VEILYLIFREYGALAALYLAVAAASAAGWSHLSSTRKDLRAHLSECSDHHRGARRARRELKDDLKLHHARIYERLDALAKDVGRLEGFVDARGCGGGKQ